MTLFHDNTGDVDNRKPLEYNNGKMENRNWISNANLIFAKYFQIYSGVV